MINSLSSATGSKPHSSAPDPWFTETLDINRPTRGVVLSAAEDYRDVPCAMRLGARGVILKQSATDLLIKGIHRVDAGEIWLETV
jgi:DNA-binding NarL/FixJ family response regulator